MGTFGTVEVLSVWIAGWRGKKHTMRRNTFALAGLSGLLAASALVVTNTGGATAAEADCQAGSACVWSEKNYGGTLSAYTNDEKNKCINQDFASAKNNLAQDSQTAMLTYEQPECVEDNKGGGGDQIPPGGFARPTRVGKSLKLLNNPDGSSSSGEAGEGQQSPIDDLINQLPEAPVPAP